MASSQSTTYQQLHKNKLKESGLTLGDAKKLGIEPQGKIKTKQQTGFDCASTFIPYFTIDGKINCYGRTRLYAESIDKEKDKLDKKHNKKIPKYISPKGSTPKFYLPPILPKVTWQQVADDTDEPIVITEGEFKAAKSCKENMPTIGLGGVWAWRSKKKGVGLIEDFNQFKWKKRTVGLVFDSDLKTNDKVKEALMALAKELTDLGALVHIVYLPDIKGLDKTGLDDFLVHRSMDDLVTLLNKAPQFSMCRELWQMNEEIAYIKTPGFIVDRRTGNYLSASDLTTHAFSNRFMDMIKGDKVEQVLVAREWLKWSQRFELEKVVYSPGEPEITDNGEYNTYRGMGCEPKKGSITPWNKLMEAVFGSDKEARSWFERWCAIQFQQPGVKLRSAVIIWSAEQGTGKSFIGYTLRQLFGSDNFVELTETDIHEKHNEWAAHTQFVMGDEITGSDKRRDANKLKQMITREEVTINMKAIRQFKIKDHINYYFTSNRCNAIYLETGDRRYFVQEVQNALSEEFFTKVYDKWLYEQDGDRHLLHYFLNLPLKGFNYKTRPPVTSSKIDMLELGMGALETWVYRLMKTPEEVLSMNDTYIDSDLWTSEMLADIYNVDNERQPVQNNTMGRVLKNMGCYKLPPIRIGEKTKRLVAIRNFRKWKKATKEQVRKHYLEYFPEEKGRENKFKK